ncbi:SPATS2-like protein isoform X1 [Asterias rubens]|uniref:SPATS2-like protein isoform X1 n=2 Tax=Asterias rubens TaxID=7604 RepID=UPI001455C1E3|nr:SPATS2-like protein isoform X1 [Asterias rubens]
MARKQRTGDSSADVYFDTRTKAVLTQTSHNSMANVKEQVAKVREVVPHIKKEDILLVLQHFDGDVQRTIQAFMEGGADDILKEWNIPNKRKTGNNMNKKNKKRKPKQSQEEKPQEENGEGRISNGLQEEHPSNNNNIDKPVESKMDIKPGPKTEEITPKAGTQQPKSGVTSNVQKPQPQQQSHPKPVNSPQQQRKPQQHKQQQEQQHSNNNKKVDTASKPKGESGRSVHKQSQEKHPTQTSSDGSAHHKTSNKPASGPAAGGRKGKDDPGQRSGQTGAPKQGQSAEGGSKRERTVSESSSVTDSRFKKPGLTLDKSSKDLQRTAVSLTRHKNLLAEEIDKAEKRLKKAFDGARSSLSTKEEELMRQLLEVKRRATSLLDERQHKAFELKQETNRSASKTDQELLELRADIKHFVSERKIDEDIGRTPRFTGSIDPLQTAIKEFGEVIPVKTVYSTRRPSLTSLTSIESLSRPTSISDDRSGNFSHSSTTVESRPKDASSVPVTPTSPDVDIESEVAKMAAKMQRSLQTQGQRGRGPRNPRQQGNNNRQGYQGSNPRQGQSAKEGSRPDQRGNNNNRGRQEGNQVYQNSQHKGDNRQQSDKPHHDRPHSDKPRNDRPRNDRPRNDRGEGSRGKDEQGPRNKDRNIRRREQYRRRHDQEGSTEKEVGATVTGPDSIPIPQNGPSTDVADKKTAPVVGKNQANDEKKKEVPAVDKAAPVKDTTLSPAVEKTEVPSVNGSISTEDLKPSKPKSPAHHDQQIISKNEKKDVPVMMNGNAGSSPESKPTEALPQRKPRENRNRKKAEDKVMETPVVNGIVNGEAEPVMVNGESNGH